METSIIANSEPEFVMAITTIRHFINERMDKNDPELSFKISSVVSQLNMMVNYCFERQQSNVHTIVFNKKELPFHCVKLILDTLDWIKQHYRNNGQKIDSVLSLLGKEMLWKLYSISELNSKFCFFFRSFLFKLISHDYKNSCRLSTDVSSVKTNLLEIRQTQLELSNDILFSNANPQFVAAMQFFENSVLSKVKNYPDMFDELAKKYRRAFKSKTTSFYDIYAAKLGWKRVSFVSYSSPRRHIEFLLILYIPIWVIANFVAVILCLSNSDHCKECQFFSLYADGVPDNAWCWLRNAFFLLMDVAVLCALESCDRTPFTSIHDKTMRMIEIEYRKKYNDLIESFIIQKYSVLDKVNVDFNASDLSADNWTSCFFKNIVEEVDNISEQVAKKRLLLQGEGNNDKTDNLCRSKLDAIKEPLLNPGSKTASYSSVD